MRVTRQTVELVAGSGITALLTIIYVIYVGRVIGPSEYSDFAAALSVIYFVGLAVSPLTPTIARLTARFEARGDRAAVSRLRTAAQRRIALLGVVFTAFGAGLAPYIAGALRFRSSLPLILAFVVVLVYSIVNIDRGVAHGLYRFRLYNVSTVIEAVARLAAVLLVFAVAPSAWTAMASYAFALVVAAVALAVPLGRTLPHADDTVVDWKEVRRLTVPMVVLMFSLAVFQNADMMAVKRWFDSSPAGLYGAASALARGMAVVVVPFYVIAGPVLTGLHEARRPVFRTTIDLTAACIAVAIIPFVVVLIWSERVVRLLYGADFVAAAPLVAPLCGLAMITYAGLMLSQALVTVHDFRFLTGYVSVAVIEVVALIAFHGHYGQVLTVLYICQSAAVIVVALFFVDAWRKWRPAS
jgi:O-antigen/teichoic acid export membrane protein